MGETTDEFFARRRSAEELRRLQIEADQIRADAAAARPRPLTEYPELNPAALRRVRSSKKHQRAVKKASEERRMKDPEYRKARLDYQRRYREENPDRVKESQENWRAKDPERARKKDRQSRQESRDRRPEANRARERSDANLRRQRNPDGYKDWYNANIERERERGREASRLRSRLKTLGLPPRQIHRTYAEEKRIHASAAEAFFSRKRAESTIRRLRARETPDEGPRLRAEELFEKRYRAETGRRVREFADGPAKLSVQIDRELDYAPLRSKITSEVRMDSRARELRGKKPYVEEIEVRRRVAARMPDDFLDAKLMAQHITSRLWWKQRSGREIEDVLFWSSAHREASPQHAAVHQEIHARIAAQIQAKQTPKPSPAQPSATGPAVQNVARSTAAPGLT